MLSADRLAGGLVLLKAVDVVQRGPLALPAPVWGVVLGAWIAGGLALLLRPSIPSPRLWWAVVGLAGVGLAVDLPLELRRQHLVLLGFVALTAAVARNRPELLLLWRVQISVLYGASALAKVNESFLGGDVLAGSVVHAPFWSAVLPAPPTAVLLATGVAVVLTEAFLAAAPWVSRLRPPGLALAVALHGSTLLLVSTTPLVGLRLAFFGGLAVLLQAASAGVVAVDREP